MGDDNPWEFMGGRGSKTGIMCTAGLLILRRATKSGRRLATGAISSEEKPSIVNTKGMRPRRITAAAMFTLACSGTLSSMHDCTVVHVFESVST